jgi:hypothetical protein
MFVLVLYSVLFIVLPDEEADPRMIFERQQSGHGYSDDGMSKMSVVHKKLRNV